jgi:hypothetical protein
LALISRYLPLIVAIALVAMMTLEVGRRPNAADAHPFHVAAAAAINALPLQFDNWQGTDVPIPAAAQALLKPNAILSRQYVDKVTGEQVSVSLVQCADTRDMQGHYPPICYPGVGWVERSDARRVEEVQIGSRVIRAVRYEFVRQTFDQDRVLIIYNFFAIPAKGFPTDMDEIRQVASDYTCRAFGAAQIQVAMNRGLGLAEERAFVGSVLAPFGPVLDLLSDPKWKK